MNYSTQPAQETSITSSNVSFSTQYWNEKKKLDAEYNWAVFQMNCTMLAWKYDNRLIRAMSPEMAKRLGL
jgi:hypothetical protein